MNRKKTLCLPFILITTLLLLAGCVGKPVQPNPTATLTAPSPSNTPAVTLPPIVIPTNTPLATATPTLGIGSTWVRPADGMEMVYVPEGEFTMGSIDGPDAEKPAHQVYLDAYWIDRTEVTNAMFALCVQAGHCKKPAPRERSSEYDEHPAIFIKWDNAQSYCSWAEARLPTEAEWEKAARGTDGRIYPWGNDKDPAKYYVVYYYQDTKPVRSYPSGASPYGALDMAGGVWEWINDWYSSTYYQSSPLSNPQGPVSGDERVVRGGSWYDYKDGVRSAYRVGIIPSSYALSYGFRCAGGTSP